MLERNFFPNYFLSSRYATYAWGIFYMNASIEAKKVRTGRNYLPFTNWNFNFASSTVGGAQYNESIQSEWESASGRILHF